LAELLVSGEPLLVSYNDYISGREPMYRVIAHYPPSTHPDRDPQARYGGSISYDYATRAEAQERYAREACETKAIELWYIEPGQNQRLNPFAWPQGR
jgi:hypothetical protein